MLQTVLDYIDNKKLINPGERIVLGISGGADSVCLLFVLLEYKKRVKFDLSAIHVNHMIRGEEALADEKYVCELCRNNGIDCTVTKVDIPAISKSNGTGLEETARIERYRILRSAEADKIAVAHHADDKAETVLFNLIRGSGLKGLSTLKPEKDGIIRPLLCVQKWEIEEYLTKTGIKYCTDSTNSDINYSRNRIRNNIIPQMISINSNAVTHIEECSELISEAEDYIKNISDIKTGLIFDDNCIDIGLLLQEPEILQKRIIKNAIVKISDHEKDITKTHVHDVLELINKQSGRVISLPYGLVAYREYDKIIISHNRKEASINFGKIIIEHIKPNDINAYPTDTYTKWIDYAKIKNGAVLRNRMPGDYIQIKNGSKKIQDLFTDLKIPASKRDVVPLICDGKEIIWVVGYRISEKYKITAETKDIVQITYMEENNGD